MKTRIKAYAKINLHLDVTGIRDDGYHNIRSIMQSVSLCDIVDIEIIDGQKIVIECDTAGVPLDERNIAYKAAARFFERAGKTCG
ncbi:MAG: 4-(cytidine 5'-diphospho)-2-C-methyl-D-erythritol kinase, partial [Clostridia bacterium]|nr:4-(cytidine 5'-diphospho)-2-C-methyl-D-erythritol kinase [Clostridia bacterium]